MKMYYCSPCVNTIPPFLSLGPDAKKADMACCRERGRPVKRLSLNVLKKKRDMLRTVQYWSTFWS